MQILVTGGAGYIGSHTCKALAEAGHEPIVFDNLSEGHAHAVRWGPLVTGDLCDETALRRVFQDYKVSAVIHFAANAYVGESIRNPKKYFRNNFVATLNLLDAMVENKIRAIVLSSTCAVYGVPSSLPIREEDPRQPCNPYGESKLAVERALGWYANAYGIQFMGLRYFNAAGCDPGGELGEEHREETHLIPLAIQAALGMRPQLDVFGSDYPTEDGSAVRDFIHVSDLADAHVRALHLLGRSDASEFLNLGTGAGISVLKVAESVGVAVGRSVPTRLLPRRPGDPPVLVADAARARQRLPWAPRYSAIDTIVQTALNFERAKSHSQHLLVVAGGH